MKKYVWYAVNANELFIACTAETELYYMAPLFFTDVAGQIEFGIYIGEL